ncbi:prolipoprotein diacylglyceryl transferase [Chitiniphilus shinanonensis]|uniref:Phosphatidylglycerol--prolipoprotein diacylglyceryl transferase n=1 Tax=Chitiniphilus shinanonensis TaxID=553088 RepID=F8WSR0_9NEIS|nr:prolipoprotein diacylglyceryl transferase [Chitiniphilus shinanonensis]BAK53897.1 prolipoprotein diacylglyceryl transferase [Chitiniphilus shinanonensis]GLS03639.1 prolipoprotein diacylglyceryl transferase [Chitiniphilus shinanonensis]
MLVHPQFDPIAFSLGPVSVHWYGLMYLLGFLLFLGLGRWRIKRGNPAGWQVQDLDDLLFYGVLGVIVGGRLGYVLFYKPDFYLHHPIDIIKVWEGGMAFHGGFLGVLVALWLFGRKTGRSFFQVSDLVAPLVPLGLAFGRLGNFINGELWGRVTSIDAPWAMGFPQARSADASLAATNPQWQEWLFQYGMLPRHPSQLYQFALEGVVLFSILWWYSAKPRKTGQVSALFLLGYGLFRFIAEFAREPDDFLGLLAMNLSMGQWLSLPMILIGAHMLWWSSRSR